MISDFDAFHGRDRQASSWQKVTRRMVDPITFSCRVNVANVPRIEDCSYETTDFAVGHPRFEERLPITVNGTKNRGHISSDSTGRPKVGGSQTGVSDDAAWRVHDFPLPIDSNTGISSKRSSLRSGPAGKDNNRVSLAKHGGSRDGAKSVASLGAFFSKTSVNDAVDTDNRSISSRSMNSKSVSELSNAERSKVEERLKNRRKNKMLSIDEQSSSAFDEEKASGKGGTLGNFLREKTAPFLKKVEDDSRSTMSASTLGSKVSRMSTADRSKNEKKLKYARGAKPRHDGVSDARDGGIPKKEKKKLEFMLDMPLKSILKKDSNEVSTRKRRQLEIKDGHDMKEVPTLDDKEWYRDWDDIWYSEEELADMRYEAFLEEAGLDVGEFMNM